MVGELQPILAQAGVPPLQIIDIVAGFLRADAAAQAMALSLVQAADRQGSAAVQNLAGAYAASFPRPGGG
jgi:hypothetical protein